MLNALNGRGCSAPRSAPVEPARVVAQNGRLVLLLEIFPLQDLIDFFHTVRNRNLVVEIGSEHKWLWAHALDRVGERFLVAFTTDKDSIISKIVGGMALALEPAIFKFTLQAIKHERDPRRAALHEPHAQFWETIEHAVDHHSRQRDRQWKRHAEGARRGKY